MDGIETAGSLRAERKNGHTFISYFAQPSIPAVERLFSFRYCTEKLHKDTKLEK